MDFWLVRMRSSLSWLASRRFWLARIFCWLARIAFWLTRTSSLAMEKTPCEWTNGPRLLRAITTYGVVSIRFLAALVPQQLDRATALTANQLYRSRFKCHQFFVDFPFRFVPSRPFAELTIRIRRQRPAL